MLEDFILNSFCQKNAGPLVFATFTIFLFSSSSFSLSYPPLLAFPLLLHLQSSPLFFPRLPFFASFLSSPFDFSQSCSPAPSLDSIILWPVVPSYAFLIFLCLEFLSACSLVNWVEVQIGKEAEFGVLGASL